MEAKEWNEDCKLNLEIAEFKGENTEGEEEQVEEVDGGTVNMKDITAVAVL